MLDSTPQRPHGPPGPEEPQGGAPRRAAQSLPAAFALGLVSVARLDVDPLLVPRHHVQPMWFVAVLAFISCLASSGVTVATYLSAMVTIAVVRQTTDKYLPQSHLVPGLRVAQQYVVAMATLFLNIVFLLGKLVFLAHPDPDIAARGTEYPHDMFAWVFYLVLMVSVKKKLRWLDSTRQTDALNRST